ncbi:MAG: hypothetical protein MHM6MM_004749 [Cercozoa sp. M6MM]
MAPEGRPAWHRDSWRTFPVRQQANFTAADVTRVASTLRERAPLVSRGGVFSLRNELAAALRGERFLLQGGDCAERFSECQIDRVRRNLCTLNKMRQTLLAQTPEVTVIGRMAGQFFKPRSCAEERLSCGRIVPVYKGDAINGESVDSRAHDAKRLLRAYDCAAAVLQALAQLSSQAHFRHTCAQTSPETSAETFAEASRKPANYVFDFPLYTSHEALLLEYESALTRDTLATSGHMLWIGDRTRQLDGGHVEYLRGVDNVVGVKVGPSASAHEVLRIVRRLGHERVVLISRLGEANVESHLPRLLEALREASLLNEVAIMCDPCHGNTEVCHLRDSRGETIKRKTRRVTAILRELSLTFQVAHRHGARVHGVHLELCGDDGVLECLDDDAHDAAALESQYLTACDPRLNERQAVRVAQHVTRLLARYRLDEPTATSTPPATP